MRENYENHKNTLLLFYSVLGHNLLNINYLDKILVKILFKTTLFVSIGPNFFYFWSDLKNETMC